jgi:hypothetical protein
MVREPPIERPKIEDWETKPRVPGSPETASLRIGTSSPARSISVALAPTNMMLRRATKKKFSMCGGSPSLAAPCASLTQ